MHRRRDMETPAPRSSIESSGLQEKETSASLAIRRLSNGMESMRNIRGYRVKGEKQGEGGGIVNGDSVEWQVCECHQLTAPTYLYPRGTKGAITNPVAVDRLSEQGRGW